MQMKFHQPFHNPFAIRMMKAARKAADAMQKRAIAASASIIQAAMKQSSPGMQPGGDAAAEPAADLPGHFVERALANAAGARAYKLYIPASYVGQPMPLLVMLHGCTQDPDDFASGTRMNQIAEKNGCFVAYPAQTESANGRKCWNWFNAIDQQRDQGEASIIADITREIMADYHCDPRRIFVAGLSAGGAMAVIMGNRYPELYRAVGVHSGLPYAAARDLRSALVAMRRGAARAGPAGDGRALPVIVFHGDRDKTVHPRNGERIIEQALTDIAKTIRKEEGVADGGHRYTRVIYDGDRRSIAEFWTLHGASHAWSGGSAGGSYTDTRGPDASAEMMRFFTTVAMAERGADRNDLFS
jgi:poly(hydroxyalkanoate) depolymerase family esterase